MKKMKAQKTKNWKNDPATLDSGRRYSIIRQKTAPFGDSYTNELFIFVIDIYRLHDIFYSCHIIHQTCDGDTLDFCCLGKQKFIIAFGVLFFIVGPVLTALRKGKPSCAAEAVLGAVLLGSASMFNFFDTILSLPSTHCGCLMICEELRVCYKYASWLENLVLYCTSNNPSNDESGTPNTKMAVLFR